MKGIYKKRILKITALLIVMVLIAFICESLLIRTTSAAEAHIKNFYREPKNSLDVAVIGCSEMYADYSPPIAYRNFGFTSYNLAVEGVPTSSIRCWMSFCRGRILSWWCLRSTASSIPKNTSP